MGDRGSFHRSKDSRRTSTSCTYRSFRLISCSTLCLVSDWSSWSISAAVHGRSRKGSASAKTVKIRGKALEGFENAVEGQGKAVSHQGQT